jgi:PadR family transcriptional regulator, regulatory protein PadR
MEVAGVRVTPQTAAVLKVLLKAPDVGMYGLEIAQAVRLPTGTIYPALVRLEHAGWIAGTWEDPKQVAAEGRRRRRRFYQLTQSGRRAATEAVQRTESTWVLLPGIRPGSGETPA